MKKILSALLIFTLLTSPCYAIHKRNTGWGQTKPPVGAQIDLSHPLSRGLVGCWLMNEGGGKLSNDLCKNVNMTIDTSADFTISKKGYGIKCTVNDNGARTSTNIEKFKTNSYTMVTLFIQLGTPTNFTPITGLLYDNVDTAPYGDNFDWTQSTNRRLRFAFNNGTARELLGPAISLQLNTPIFLAATYKSGSQIFYRDGVIYGTPLTYTGNPSYSSNS